MYRRLPSAIPALTALKRCADIQFVHISGGEPTLHPNLRNFVATVHEVHPRLRLFSNMWWFPEHQDRVTTVLPFITELVLTIHPESRLTLAQMRKEAGVLSKQYKLRVSVWQQRTFVQASFTENPNGRDELYNCSLPRHEGRRQGGAMRHYVPSAAEHGYEPV